MPGFPVLCCLLEFAQKWLGGVGSGGEGATEDEMVGWHH